MWLMNFGKAKGEGIIKITVHEVKVEHKPNFGNAFTHKLFHNAKN
jgi:hypothetical protein